MSKLRNGITTQEIDLGSVGLHFNDYEEEKKLFEEVAYEDDRGHLILKKDVLFHVYAPYHSYYRKMELYDVYFDLKEFDFDEAYLTIDKNTLETCSEILP